MSRHCAKNNEMDIDWTELEKKSKKPKEPVRHDWTKEDFVAYRRTMCRISQRNRRKAAKQHGICTMCCKNMARPGRKTCQECSDRSNEWNRRVRKEQEK